MIIVLLRHKLLKVRKSRHISHEPKNNTGLNFYDELYYTFGFLPINVHERRQSITLLRFLPAAEPIYFSSHVPINYSEEQSIYLRLDALAPGEKIFTQKMI